jgi:RNA polymerase sigma factor (sigma-70 family)
MFKFEDKNEELNKLLDIKRSDWMLNNILQYEDLCQIIRLHIYKKFSQWDQSRPFSAWASRVISNQIKNQIRNHYGRLTPPCIKGKGCPFNTGDGCQMTKSGQKDSSCAAYAKWERSKKPAYELKTAAPLEDFDGACNSPYFNFEQSVEKFHREMKRVLSDREYFAYDLIYLQHLSDEIVAQKMGFKTKEANRIPGYRQISNLKVKLTQIGKQVLETMDLEY